MTDFPNPKSILKAANQILARYYGDALDAWLHAARLSDEFLENGDIDGHLLWLKIHQAIVEMTDLDVEGETVH